LPPRRGLARFLSRRVFWRVNAEEPEAKLGLILADGDEGIPVADALDLGDDGAGSGGVGGTEKEDRIGDGNGKSSVGDTQYQTAYRWKSHLLHAPANL